MTGQLSREAVRRLAALRVHRFTPGQAMVIGALPAEERRVFDNHEAQAHVVARWGSDLCGLLNALTRGELGALAAALGVANGNIAAARTPVLRAALWEHGARLEAGGAEVTPSLQPRPIVLGGHLVVQAAPRGPYPPSLHWPRPLPEPRPPLPPDGEPETLDDLLAAADRAVGVRLGRRGRDKGAWGLRAAALLGIVERGLDEPDWRGDVEVKTVPVGRDPTGAWRVLEDPAIAMLGEPVLAKLQRTLWLARVTLDPEQEQELEPGLAPALGLEGAPPRRPGRPALAGEDDDATILSWYLLDWDAEIARLARRYLHERPKGPAGTNQRGLYLHRRFFADAGLLATLNGPTP